jgi:membrane protease YdiL (CAAX protease family)
VVGSTVGLMSVTDEPQPTAKGWYPDPFGRHRVRWWDGEGWTAYAGDGAAVQWDPRPIEEPEEHRPGMPGIVTAFIAFGGGAAAAFLVGLAVSSDKQDRAAEIAVSSLALWVPLVLGCVLVSRRRGTGSLRRDYGLQFRWSDLGIGLAGAVAGRLLSASFVAPIPFPSRSLNEVDEAMFGTSIEGAATWTALVVVTCVGAPLIEELFFRGLVQARLVDRYGTAVGVGAASLLFGAAHLMAWQGAWTFAYAWAITGGGLVLGTIFHMTRRLGPAVAAHAFFNIQAMLVLAFLT